FRYPLRRTNRQDQCDGTSHQKAHENDLIRLQDIKQLLHKLDIEIHRILNIRFWTSPIAWQVGSEDTMMARQWSNHPHELRNEIIAGSETSLKICRLVVNYGISGAENGCFIKHGEDTPGSVFDKHPSEFPLQFSDSSLQLAQSVSALKRKPR